MASTETLLDKKHLKNVGPIRHCEPPHAALPFTRCRYCRMPPAHQCPQQRQQRMTGDRYGPIEFHSGETLNCQVLIAVKLASTQKIAVYAKYKCHKIIIRQVIF